MSLHSRPPSEHARKDVREGDFTWQKCPEEVINYLKMNSIMHYLIPNFEKTNIHMKLWSPNVFNGRVWWRGGPDPWIPPFNRRLL